MTRRAVLILAATVAGCSLARSAPLGTLDVRGSVGVLHEWSLSVRLTPGPHEEAYGGALTMRHTGLCDSHGESTKTGTMSTIVRDGHLYAMDLKFGDEECTLAGPVRLRETSTTDVLQCKGMRVPITLWSDAAP